MPSRVTILHFNLEIRLSPGRGRGVFAGQPFAKGERVERCPVIPISFQEWEQAKQTFLYYYIYRWNQPYILDDPAPDLTSLPWCLALGYGSLYNHSYQPNLILRRHLVAQHIDFIAHRDIAQDEELTINYNDDPNDQSPLWFEVR